MPYNFVADRFHTKKLCSRLSKCDFRRKTAVLRFEPPLGDLGATYDNHFRLIGKRVLALPISVIGTFSLDVTTEALRANIGSKSAISL